MLVAYPLQAALAKEMGEEFVSNGLVGEALHGWGRTSSGSFLLTACSKAQITGRSPAAIQQRVLGSQC